MLQELSDFEVDRRWFSDNSMELIIWYDSDRITGFKLCYDKFIAEGEKVFTWNIESGFSHSHIDYCSADEGIMHCRNTPMLVSAGEFQWQKVTKDFLKKAKRLPHKIIGFVLSKLAAYSMLSNDTDKISMHDTTYIQQSNISILLNLTQADF